MFCSKCGKEIDTEAVVCPFCGVPTQNYQKQSSSDTAQPAINIVNTNTNTNVVGGFGRPKNKWVALALCFFLGVVGGHKFYEGKVGMGILYLFTIGLFGIGVVVDFIIILTKPNPYFV